MTMRYAHFTPDHLQGSIKFMNMTGENSEAIPALGLRETNVMDELTILDS